MMIIIERFEFCGTVLRANAMSANIPPSPLLLARITNKTYFKDTTIKKAQKTIDRTPNTLSCEKGMP